MDHGSVVHVKGWQAQQTDRLKDTGREAKNSHPCVFATSSVAGQNAIALGALCALSAVRVICRRLQVVENALRQHLVLSVENIPADAGDGDHLEPQLPHLIQILACFLDVGVNAVQIRYKNDRGVDLDGGFQHTLHAGAISAPVAQMAEIKL